VGDSSDLPVHTVITLTFMWRADAIRSTGTPSFTALVIIPCSWIGDKPTLQHRLRRRVARAGKKGIIRTVTNNPYGGPIR
jgi:hypothetical protein